MAEMKVEDKKVAQLMANSLLDRVAPTPPDLHRMGELLEDRIGGPKRATQKS